MHIFSLPITIPPEVVAILLVILFIFIVLLRLTSRRQRRRTGGVQRRRPQRTKRNIRSRRHDHGATIASKHGRARSPEWHRVEKEHLLHEPACLACGYRGKGLQVHHIKPFHLHPNLELDPTNLITLCEIKGRNHHLLLGHLDEWESYNPNVRDDVRRYHGKSADQIRHDPNWKKAVARRPGPV